jgi:thiamine biosynthesis lipoprotein
VISGSGAMLNGAPSGAGLPMRPVAARAEPVMGTVVSFAVLPGDLTDAELWSALEAACAVLHRAEAVFSTWDPRSAVSRLRRGEAGPGPLPTELAEVTAQCQLARDVSGGWFDPWALPGGYDPTGLVKGWAVDGALAALRQAGVPAAIVNGGGDLAAFGSPAPRQRWRAGIRHPWRRNALAAVVEVGAAVATSGTYERGAHLVDPRTGRPGSRAASATVTGPSLALADALATALAVGGDAALDAVAALESYDGYLIRPDGSEASTGGFAFAATGPTSTGEVTAGPQALE